MVWLALLVISPALILAAAMSMDTGSTDAGQMLVFMTIGLPFTCGLALVLIAAGLMRREYTLAWWANAIPLLWISLTALGVVVAGGLG